MKSYGAKNIRRLLAATFAATTLTWCGGTVHAEEVASKPESVSEPVLTESTGDDRFKDHNFSIEGRFFAPHFDAKVESKKINYNGGEVGLKENLGFGNDNAPEVILRYKRLSIDYIYINGHGHKTYSGNNVLTFGGNKYRGHVDSKNTVHYLKINVTNPIKTTDDGSFTWSYGLTGIFWKGEVSGHDSHGKSIKQSEKYGAPLPTLGLGVQLDIMPQFKVYANASGIYAGHYGHFYDLEAGVRYKPAPHFAITAGYRKIEAKAKHKDEHGKFTMNGPFAGIRFDF